MNLDEVAAEIRYRIDRIRLYGEAPHSFKDWIPWLADLETATLAIADNIHDECNSNDQVDHLIEQALEDCEGCKCSQQNIDNLQSEVGDLKMKLNSLDLTPNLSPEQARARFRVIQ